MARSFFRSFQFISPIAHLHFQGLIFTAEIAEIAEEDARGCLFSADEDQMDADEIQLNFIPVHLIRFVNDPRAR